MVMAISRPLHRGHRSRNESREFGEYAVNLGRIGTIVYRRAEERTMTRSRAALKISRTRHNDSTELAEAVDIPISVRAPGCIYR